MKLNKFLFIIFLSQININSTTITLFHKTLYPRMDALMTVLADRKFLKYSSLSDYAFMLDEYCAKYFPQEREIIEESIIYTSDNFIHSIVWGNPLFKSGITKHQKSIVIKDIKRIRNTIKNKEVYEEIKQKHLDLYGRWIDSSKSEFIFINSSYVNISDLQRYKELDHKVFNVVIYYDLEQAFEYFVKSNEFGVPNHNDNKYRHYAREFLENLYNEFKPAVKGDMVIGCFKRESIFKIFEYFQKNLTKNIFKKLGQLALGELTEKSLNKLQEKIISKFGLDNQEYIDITYTKPFDLFIDLSNNNLPKEISNLMRYIGAEN